MAKISINLAKPNSIRDAVYKVQQMADSATALSDKIVIETTEKLLAKIKANAAGIGTGAMLDTIQAKISYGVNGGIVGEIWGADWITYVEHGTGTVGGVENPKSPEGWVYFNEVVGHYVFTEGMEARPFMRTAFEEVLAELPSTVKVRFEEWTHLT